MDALETPGRRVPGLLLIALAVTLASYARSLSFDFVYDDVPQIVENEFIRAWPGWNALLSRHEWSHVYPEAAGNYFRPVSLLWRIGNYALFGPDPFAWHLSSVTVHLGVTCLAYALVLALARDRLVAGASALLFGVHPVHIETVAWITGVIDALLALFFLASFLAYLQALAAPRDGARRVGWRAASLALFCVALLTKETAAVVPGLVFVHQWLLAARDAPGRVARLAAACREAAPYVVVTLAYLLVRGAALGGVAHASSSVDLSAFLLTLPSLVWFYLGHLVVPVGLSAFYDAQYATSFSPARDGLPLLGLLLVAAGLVRWSRATPTVGFAAAWMVLPLLPALALPLLPYEDFVHDRFLYVPSLGACMLVATALARLPAGGARAFGQPLAPLAATMSIAGAMAVATAHQSLQWKDDLHLFRHGVAVAPGNHVAANNLATVLLERGEFAEAARLYERVLARRPDSWLSNSNLGQAYYNLGRLDEAERVLEKAIALDDRGADQFLFLAFVKMGQGQLGAAEAAFRAAIERSPDEPGYHYALGNLLERRGRLAEAAAAFGRELEIDPEQALARERLERLRRALAARGER